MAYKRYEKYTDSGVEWIGEIPEHWEVCKLKHVLRELVSGGTPTSTDEENWTEDEDGINWISISDMSNTDNVYKTTKKITLKGLREKNLKILRSGTLIYSIYATLGKVAELKIDAATNQAILGLILKEEQVNKRFMKRYLEALQRYILYLSSSNTQNNLNAEKVKNIDLVLPEINEQITIANFLDQRTAEIDSLIADKERLIELLQEQRQAIISKTVTKGLDPNVPMKDSGVEWIGEIPEGWVISKIRYIVYCLDGKRVPLSAEQRGEMQGDIPYWGANCVIDYVNDWLIDDEVVLLGEDGAPFFDKTKRVAFYSHEKIWPNNHVHVLKPLDKIEARFLAYYLNIVDYTNYINGSTRDKLTQSAMKEIPIQLPPKEEQIAIADFLDQKTNEIDNLICDIQTQIAKLKEYRQSLIFEAVTGKINVRDFAPNTEGVIVSA